MEKNNFIEYLVRNKVENFIFAMGFMFAIMGYTFWHPLGIMLNLTEEQSYHIFYICISVSFFFYTFAYFLTKYHKWRWFPMFVYLVCLSRVMIEITDFDNVGQHDIIEYALFVLTIFIVFAAYVKFKYKKFLDEKDNDNNIN